jgi:ribosomal-protein-alanine N-acetyltransferase
MARLAALERLCFREAWDAAALSSLLANPAVGVMGWEQGREIVAYLLYQRVAEEAEILRIGVMPGQRRHGLAGRLLAEFLGWARSQGITRVLLDVRAGNAAALALYRRAGFHHKGTRARYYRNPAEDALLFEYDVSRDGASG